MAKIPALLPRMKTALVAAAGLLALAAVGTATAPPGSGDYSGPGTIVTAFQLNPPGIDGGTITVADNGDVVCRDTNADGTPDAGQGGVCIPFADATGDSIYVHDIGVDDDKLAFQVCIDNNGDGVCGGPQVGGCRDQIVFSHDTRTGANHNPLLVPAQGFLPGCNQGQFPGFVVITCAGVHSNPLGSGSHTHQVYSGTATSVNGGTGFGDFCGAPTAAKGYQVI